MADANSLTVSPGDFFLYDPHYGSRLQGRREALAKTLSAQDNWCPQHLHPGRPPGEVMWHPRAIQNIVFLDKNEDKKPNFSKLERDSNSITKEKKYNSRINENDVDSVLSNREINYVDFDDETGEINTYQYENYLGVENINHDEKQIDGKVNQESTFSHTEEQNKGPSFLKNPFIPQAVADADKSFSAPHQNNNQPLFPNIPTPVKNKDSLDLPNKPPAAVESKVLPPALPNVPASAVESKVSPHASPNVPAAAVESKVLPPAPPNVPAAAVESKVPPPAPPNVPAAAVESKVPPPDPPNVPAAAVESKVSAPDSPNNPAAAAESKVPPPAPPNVPAAVVESKVPPPAPPNIPAVAAEIKVPPPAPAAHAVFVIDKAPPNPPDNAAVSVPKVKVPNHASLPVQASMASESKSNADQNNAHSSSQEDVCKLLVERQSEHLSPLTTINRRIMVARPPLTRQQTSEVYRKGCGLIPDRAPDGQLTWKEGGMLYIPKNDTGEKRFASVTVYNADFEPFVPYNHTIFFEGRPHPQVADKDRKIILSRLAGWDDVDTPTKLRACPDLPCLLTTNWKKYYRTASAATFNGKL